MGALVWMDSSHTAFLNVLFLSLFTTLCLFNAEVDTMAKSVKISKLQLKEIIRVHVKKFLKEQNEKVLRVHGEEEAMQDIKDWMTITNPHGTTRQNFLRFLNKDLAKKYGREAVMLAFDTIKQDKGTIITKKTRDGKIVVAWNKDRYATN